VAKVKSMMQRFWLRAGTCALAGAVIAAACAAFAAPSYAASLGQGGAHQISIMSLIRKHPALDRGVMTYSKLTVMQARQTASFQVEVTDVGRGPERSAATRVPGARIVAPQDVPMGGIVSVQIVCSNGLTCTSRSSVRQVIASQGRSGVWRWNVAAGSPGEAWILLVATSYRRGSNAVLDRTSEFVHVKIQATPLYYLESGLHAGRAVVFLALGGVLVAAGVLGAVLALRRRVRHGKGATTPRPDLSVALTEPLRLPAGLSRGPAPAARPTLSRRALMWLALIDIAAGGLVMVVVPATTAKSPGFATVVGAVIAGALPLYFLPLIIGYLRAAPDRASVAVINVLLGWTYIGWVAALALAVRDRRPDSTALPGLENSLPRYVTKRYPDGESGAPQSRRAAVS
jgi:Superinfection immunity protein